jgi:hypothetical protein
MFEAIQLEGLDLASFANTFSTCFGFSCCQVHKIYNSSAVTLPLLANVSKYLSLPSIPTTPLEQDDPREYNFHAQREEKSYGKSYRGSKRTWEPLRLLCSLILDREVAQSHRGFASRLVSMINLDHWSKWLWIIPYSPWGWLAQALYCVGDP